MLYFDTQNYSVSKSYDSGTESFSPTVEFEIGEIGYVVIVRNEQYDSNGSSGTDYIVIDAYKSPEDAIEVAEKIKQHKEDYHNWEYAAYSLGRNSRGKAPILDINYASGDKAFPINKYGQFLPWMGWGNRFDGVIVNVFKLNEYGFPKVFK